MDAPRWPGLMYRIPDSTAKLDFNFKLSPLLRATIADHLKARVCPHCVSSDRDELHDAERARRTGKPR